MELGRERCRTFIFRFGVTEIVLGCILTIFGIAVVVTGGTNEWSNENICGVALVLSVSAQGIWCGVFVVVTGVLGTVLRKKCTRKILNINLAMTFMACVLVFACFLMSVIAAVAGDVCEGGFWIIFLQIVVAVACVIAFGILLTHAILSRNGILSRIYSSDTGSSVKEGSNTTVLEMSEGATYYEKNIDYLDYEIGQSTPQDRTKSVPKNKPNVPNETLRSKDHAARASYMELGREACQTLIFRFGVTEIVIGCIMIIFGIAVILVYYTPNGSSICGVALVLTVSAQGIWCGVFVVVTGVYGTVLRRKVTKKILTINLAMTFIACILVFACFLISVIAAVAAAVCGASLIMSLHIVVAVACVIAFGILIAHAILSRNGIISKIYSSDTDAAVKAASTTTASDISEDAKYDEKSVDISDNVIEQATPKYRTKNRKDEGNPPDPLSAEDSPDDQCPVSYVNAAFVGREPSGRPSSINEKNAQSIFPASDISEAAKYFEKDIEISDHGMAKIIPEDRNKADEQKQLANLNVAVIAKDSKNAEKNTPANQSPNRNLKYELSASKNTKVLRPEYPSDDGTRQIDFSQNYESERLLDISSQKEKGDIAADLHKPFASSDEQIPTTLTVSNIHLRSEKLGPPTQTPAVTHNLEKVDDGKDRNDKVNPPAPLQAEDPQQKQFPLSYDSAALAGRNSSVWPVQIEEKTTQQTASPRSEISEAGKYFVKDIEISDDRELAKPEVRTKDVAEMQVSDVSVTVLRKVDKNETENTPADYSPNRSPKNDLSDGTDTKISCGDDTRNSYVKQTYIPRKSSAEITVGFHKSYAISDECTPSSKTVFNENLRYEKRGCPPEPQSVTEKLNTDLDTTDEVTTSASLFVTDLPKNQPPLSFNNNGTVVGSNLSVLLIQDNEKTSQSEISMPEVSEAAKYFEKDVEISDSFKKQATLKDGTKEVAEKQIVMVHVTGIEKDVFANVPGDDLRGADEQQIDYPLKSRNENLLNISSQKEAVEVTVDLLNPHAISAECSPSMQTVSNGNLRYEKLRSTPEPPPVTEKLEKSARTVHNNENISTSDMSVTEISEAAKYFVKEMEISDNEIEQGALKYRTTSVTEYKTVNVDMTIVAKDIENVGENAPTKDTSNQSSMNDSNSATYTKKYTESTVQIQSNKVKSELNTAAIDYEDCVYISFAAFDKRKAGEKQENTIEQLSSPISHWYGDSTVPHQFHDSANVFKPTPEMTDSSAARNSDSSLDTRTSAHAHVFSVDQDTDTPVKHRAVGKLHLSAPESTVPDRFRVASFDDTISQDSTVHTFAS